MPSAPIGIGVNEREVLLEAMEWGDWDAFLLAGRYTLLEQAPLEDLLPKCVARGISIVVGGPFNSGILAGRDTWNYDTGTAGDRGKGESDRRGLRTATACRCRPRRCSFRWRIRPSRRSSRGHATSPNSKPT